MIIDINITEKNDTAQIIVNNNNPTYKNEHTDTLIYNPKKTLNYRLITQHIKYYSDQTIS